MINAKMTELSVAYLKIYNSGRFVFEVALFFGTCKIFRGRECRIYEKQNNWWNGESYYYYMFSSEWLLGIQVFALNEKA